MEFFTYLFFTEPLSKAYRKNLIILTLLEFTVMFTDLSTTVFYIMRPVSTNTYVIVNISHFIVAHTKAFNKAGPVP